MGRVKESAFEFRIIENQYVDFDEIHDSFVEDYIFSSDLCNEEIRRKYGLSHKEFNRYCHTIKEEFGLSIRPNRNAKHYYKKGNSFVVQRQIDGVYYYFGHVPTEQVARKVVELCEKAKWHIGTCRDIVRNYHVLV